MSDRTGPGQERTISTQPCLRRLRMQARGRVRLCCLREVPDCSCTLNTLNAIFELLASVFGWLSVLRLSRAKAVRGVFAPTFLVSAAWAISAIGYYWSHDDAISAAICVTRAAAYVVWSCMWLHFSQRTPGQPKLRLVSTSARSAPSRSTSSQQHDP